MKNVSLELSVFEVIALQVNLEDEIERNIRLGLDTVREKNILKKLYAVCPDPNTHFCND